LCRGDLVAQRSLSQAKILVVGHSIGGFVTGFVTNGSLIDKMLLMGRIPDIGETIRPRSALMLLLWHVLMPAITSLLVTFQESGFICLRTSPRALPSNGQALKARILVEPKAR
jgi:predicted alpha/beta hydrolase